MRSGDNEKILVTGSLGQIGSELVMKLRDVYGASNVIATDIRETDSEVVTSGPFETLDVTDGQKLHDIAKRNEVDTIIHLAALLSATAEKNPLFAWNLNMGGLVNALEAARELNCKFSRQVLSVHSVHQRRKIIRHKIQFSVLLRCMG